MHVNNHAGRGVECVAIAVRELCDMRVILMIHGSLVVANSNS